ncbi:MAG: SAM-dependent methyltransferase [Gammaproteobacteria bacterium]|nr:SAM-dependent methyltransferase [Gammaproteobacteria bacterium]
MPELERIPEEHIYRAYGIYLLTSQHRLIRRLKRLYEPSIHGNKAWRSSFLLMDYLLHNPPRRGARVMELGCGWGPGAVFCARRFNARVTGVDLDASVFPYLEVISALNDVKVAPMEGNFNNLSTECLGREHLLIGSDICFWDSMVKPLFDVVSRALEGGAKRFVITDPGRPTFYELADRCQKQNWEVTLREWYAVEPSRTTGEVLEVRPPPS